MRVLFGHNKDQGGHLLAGHGLTGGDNILALFNGANAGVGFYYPTATTANLFQDTSRTTPVTTNGDSVGGLEDASGSDNHASQGTAAARPTWSEANKGLLYDGTDDVMSVSGLTGITTTMTLAGGILSTDTNFDLFGNSQAFIQASTATTTALGYGGSLWIDGVKIYNASEADALALADGAKHVFEVRACNPSADSSFSVGEAGFAGTLMSPYFTRATNANTLNSARADLASIHGITLRHTETLADQVATGGVYGPSNDTRLMFQETDGDPYTDTDQDPIGLIINPAGGVSVSESGGLRTFSGLGSELFDSGSVTVSGGWSQNGSTFTHSGVTGSESIIFAGGLMTEGAWYLYDIERLDSTGQAAQLQAGGPPITGAGQTVLTTAAERRDYFLRAESVSTLNGGRVIAAQDGVSVTVHSVKEIPGAHLYQTTAAARPLYDEASGLYDFDGTDDHFLADLTGIGDRTNMYFACVIQTTASQFGILGGSSASYYAGLVIDADLSTILNNAASGAPSYYVDGSLLSAPTRDDMHTNTSDGDRHLIEIIGINMSDVEWDSARISRNVAGFYIDGLAGEFVLIPNPGVVGRNIIRRDILARHPSITFAGA